MAGYVRVKLLAVWALTAIVALEVIIIMLRNAMWRHVDEVARSAPRKMEAGSDEKTMVNVTKLEIKPLVTNTSANVISNKPRLNVIILTHMRSGSTLTGNVFSLHPDVFYVYEPLHHLRLTIYNNPPLGEWTALDEKVNEAYKIDFSSLLRSVFTCNFTEQKTLNYAFPKFVRSERRRYFSWAEPGEKAFSEETITKVCRSKKVTVLKMMQTRLPNEIGIRELQRVCGSEPAKFACSIIHLLRDPRAVMSSHIQKKFFLGEKVTKLITPRNTSPEGNEFIKNNSRTVCSLVEQNLNYVNEEWSNWFKGRYILIRFEDIPGDIFKTAHYLYNFAGLAMDNSTREWIRKNKGRVPKYEFPFTITKNDAERVEHWRNDIESSVATAIEEACWALMYMTGYISIGASEDVLLDAKKKLRTDKIPFFPVGEGSAQ